ncbi:uncharacterized protein LOC131034168 isoform X2 [Cryptomeria japonica]|uniref:uncharacterized protein LOC131034168 isoform X2 n=1 Tax=Cryptomeria japonica TaxID=3369 RepID=UPI0027DA781D|nr:uncharacterized protein LOC131034168 isoform X2 [Cryptomeria japonica]
MIPQQWTSPCGNSCTHKYAALTQIPWRVFCKKGCDTDGDSLEDCLNDCNEICYKDPVIKDHQWSAYIDRSPGQDDNSEECFNACITGCSFKVYILNANLGSSNIHLLHLQYWCSFSSDLSKNDTFQCITQDEYQSPDEKKGIDAGLI